MFMKLGLIKALYIDELKKLYRYSEAESIFYYVLNWVEKKNKTDVILGLDTLLVNTYQDILVNLKEYFEINHQLTEKELVQLVQPLDYQSIETLATRQEVTPMANLGLFSLFKSALK